MVCGSTPPAEKGELTTLRILSNSFYFHVQTLSLCGTGKGWIADEGAAIYQVVKDKIDETRGELTHLEEAVVEQMSEKPKKKKKRGAANKANSSPASTAASIDLPDDFNLDGIDSDDSDDDDD